MALVNVKIQDKIAIIKLNNGVTNNLNLALVIEISNSLRKLKDDPFVTGVVLASENDKFFSIGFDIPKLYDAEMAEMKNFYQTFNQLCLNLYSFPKPTVAALTGHAIAGGCILAICCDYRFISDGKKLMGLNEIRLGVPVPFLADCVLRQVVGGRIARKIITSGKFYRPKESFRMGLVDMVLPLEKVLHQSIEKARSLAEMPQMAFGIIKRNQVEIIEEQVSGSLEEKEELFLDCWFSPDARKLLKRAMKKF
jgi:enoyl-CoA hydratase/carnithine racemase